MKGHLVYPPKKKRIFRWRHIKITKTPFEEMVILGLEGKGEGVILGFVCLFLLPHFGFGVFVVVVVVVVILQFLKNGNNKRLAWRNQRWKWGGARV